MTGARTPATRMRKVKGQGQSFVQRCWHDQLVFSDRMTKVAAAIGLPQLERQADILASKRRIAERHHELPADDSGAFQRPGDGVVSTDGHAVVRTDSSAHEP